MRSSATSASPRIVRAVHDNFIKATRNDLIEVRSRYRIDGHIIPSHAGVIAKTEFSTWEFLLDAEFMGRGLIWPKFLSSVFRGPWPVRQAGTVLAHARELAATLRDFRNRVFHHEPAWKRYGVLCEADALQHLREKISKAESLLDLIHPENLRLLRINGLLRDVQRACSAAEIRRFQHLARNCSVETMDALAALVHRSNAENRAVPASIRRHRFLVLPG